MAWLDREPDGVLVVAGQVFPEWLESHPRIERHAPGVRLPAYYRWLASLDLDVFLVPLTVNDFNAGKAVLKPLEAAALGMPTIVGDVAPYAGVCSAATGSLLVDPHEPEQWLAALDALAEPEARETLAARGLAWAATRTIEQTGPLHAQLWGATAWATGSSTAAS